MTRANLSGTNLNNALALGFTSIVYGNLRNQFAMSESTLRRHLALEGYNLSKIILDIRMNFGLMLLQTTQKTILQIAQEVGYESGSRFAFYFKQRFGFSPKRLR